jgi:hypothetical protein
MCSKKTIGNLSIAIGSTVLLFCSIFFIKEYTTVSDLLKEDIEHFIHPNLIYVWIAAVILLVLGFVILKTPKGIKKELKNWKKLIVSYFAETIVIIYTAIIGVLLFYSTIRLSFKIALFITGLILFYMTNEIRK